MSVTIIHSEPGASSFTSHPVDDTIVFANNGAALVGRRILYVDSIDDLVELNVSGLISGQQAGVGGYYQSGDGGGGTFYWDSVSTDVSDGGMVLQSTGVAIGRWKRTETTFAYASYWGILPDSAVSISSMQALLDWAAANDKEIVFSPGEYLINSWTAYSLDISINVRVRAYGVVFKTQSETAPALFRVKGSFHLCGGEFVDWPHNIVRIDNSEGDISGIIIEDVVFRNIGTLDEPFVIRASENANYITDVLITRCEFIACVAGINFNEERLINISVDRNSFIDLQHNCVQLGIRDTLENQGNRRNLSITNNFVNKVEGDQPSGPVIALRIYGTESRINQNVIGPVTRSVGNGDECAIFTKCTRSEVVGNIVMGSGKTPEGSGAIAIKGSRIEESDQPHGYEMIVRGNRVIDVEGVGTDGISIHADHVICESNITDGWQRPISITTKAANNIRVSNNIVRRMRSQHGIAWWRPTSVGKGNVISNNLITGWHPSNTQNFIFGISLRAIEVVEGLSVINNTFENLQSPTGSGVGQAIEVGFNQDAAIKKLTISGNVAHNCGRFLRIRTGVSNPEDLYITNNTLMDVPIGIEGTGDVNGDLVVRNNIGIITENSGTTAITDTNFHIDVEHGLDIAPTAKDIHVTPISPLENATKFWVSNVGPSTFRINVDADPGSGNEDSFAWKAFIV